MQEPFFGLVASASQPPSSVSLGRKKSIPRRSCSVKMFCLPILNLCGVLDLCNNIFFLSFFQPTFSKMNDLWCLRQIEEYDDSYYCDWEIASLEFRGETPAKIEPLDHSQILSWAQQQKGKLNETATTPSYQTKTGIAIL